MSVEAWEQLKTAYAAGVGLREIARNLKIPEGTVLARAKTRRLDQTTRRGQGHCFSPAIRCDHHAISCSLYAGAG